jgi:hypothetical protein
VSNYLDRYDVLRLGALLAFRNGEFDLLAFSERLEAVTLDSAEMRKYVGAVFLLNKAETLGAGCAAITYEKQDELQNRTSKRKT